MIPCSSNTSAGPTRSNTRCSMPPSIERTRVASPMVPRMTRFFAFAASAMRTYDQLPKSGQRPFEGKLQDLVTGTHGARPFVYNQRCDPPHAGRAGTSNLPTFVGRRNLTFWPGAEMPRSKSSKTSSGDTGRQIHRQEVNRLADLLRPVTAPLLDGAGCHLLRIVIPDRLGKSRVDFLGIVDLVKSAIAAGHIDRTHGAVTYWKEDVRWPVPERDGDTKVRPFFLSLFGTANSHLLFHWRDRNAIVAASVTSKRPNKIVAALSGEALHAAQQCSGTRPAIVALQLFDPIDPEDLNGMLHTPNGLQNIAHAVFKNETRAHIDSIAFSTPQRLEPVSATVQQMTAKVLVLNNDKAKFLSDAVRSVFRTA